MSDRYLIEYSEDNNMTSGEIDILNIDGRNWHVVDNKILGVGKLIFLSGNELVISTSKIANLSLKKR